MTMLRRSAALLGATLLATHSATAQAPTDRASPVGVWRGTSLCTVKPSSCNDEIAVYRIARGSTSDSLTLDARKLVNGQEEQMGVLGCRFTATAQFSCTIPRGVWRFTARADSLVGELRLSDNTKFRDVRTARSH
jgi:hypothetical protein